MPLSIPERLQAAVEKVETDSSKLHDIVHLPANASDVVTEGGNVKPVAKVLNELTSAAQATLDAFVDNYETTLSFQITSPIEDDILLHTNSAWRNRPKTELSDGGNF